MEITPKWQDHTRTHKTGSHLSGETPPSMPALGLSLLEILPDRPRRRSGCFAARMLDTCTVAE